MAKFRKKPVVVEACLYDGNNWNVVWDWYARMNEGKDRRFWCCPFSVGENNKVLIGTLEGTVTADVGDWIICGVKGEFYPCKPYIFSATYDVA